MPPHPTYVYLYVLLCRSSALFREIEYIHAVSVFPEHGIVYLSSTQCYLSIFHPSLIFRPSSTADWKESFALCVLSMSLGPFWMYSMGASATLLKWWEHFTHLGVVRVCAYACRWPLHQSRAKSELKSPPGLYLQHFPVSLTIRYICWP